MANNLFISYDMADPDQTFDKVVSAIEKLGDWVQVQPTLWFVKSDYTAEQAASLLWPAFNPPDDSLIVIDASANSANWQNIAPEVADFFSQSWNS